MKKWIRKILYFVLAFMMIGVTGCSTDLEESNNEQANQQQTVVDSNDQQEDQGQEDQGESNEQELIDPDGIYTTKEDVALYLYTYGELPSNFMTKKEAQALGWSGGGLDDYAENMCIGGDKFGNYEGILPEEDTYHECDIDTLNAKSRGAKRLVYSDDGDIYYTEDHYSTFELLYEGE